MIKFVSYNGEYPNLCAGTLVVEIDGRRTSFSWHNADYPEFWTSGGGVSFDEDWSETVDRGEWELCFDEKNYPRRSPPRCRS